MNEELIKRIDDKLSVICPYDEEGERTRDFDTWAILYDCRAALSHKNNAEAFIGNPKFAYGCGMHDKGGTETDMRNRQIAIATKYWADGVYFKNKHELVEALLGLCALDGEGGDGIELWDAAKDAIEGILHRAELSRKYVPMAIGDINTLKQKWIDGEVTFYEMLSSVESEAIRRAGLEVQE